MFQFPRFPLPALCVQAGVTLHDECRVSPFGHPRIDGWSAPTRGFSQPPTSFIGSCRQGIRRWPFVAWDFTHKDARARYEILKDQVRQTCRKERSHPERGERAFTTEERTGAGLDRPGVELEWSDAGECVNWVSKSSTAWWLHRMEWTP
jgi:hypothetical protein